LKILSLALLSVLCCIACQHHDRWRNVAIKTGSDRFDSSKLIYPATNFSHDLELEFLYTQGELYAYINLYAERVPPYQEDPRVASLLVEAKGQRLELLVDRLAGGQRVRIPEESLPLLLDLLEKYPYVTFVLGDFYKTRVDARDFNKHFRSLKAKKLSFVSSNPITLAF